MTDTTQSRRRFVVSVGGAALAGLAGCSSQSDGPGDSQTTTAPPDTTDATTTAEPTTSQQTTTGAQNRGSSGQVVDMVTDNQGSYFDPVGLLVEPGTTVTFVNASGDHSATAYHPDSGDQPLRIPEDAAPFDSGVYTEDGATFEYTFDVEGVYDYYCTPHEAMGMVGRIVVGAPNGGPATEPPDDLPPGARDALPSVGTIVEQTTVDGP
ncbi:plastocyanin/azurin family copper-binding protein [Halobacterium rubrum]|uniref:plastocyanin/azurin family copper-binding protein n=1 Tax=Halobacterium TaxID=2239 RepID=UPI001F00DB0D|nr:MULTISPECIES: plastocyanin/azurin family copper-binding protein [Halobacterium]MDH5020907.1 plastocyanin/azurin family copper-binding protein [Halobacterium rubrum]